jgi:hypothetical protein
MELSPAGIKTARGDKGTPSIVSVPRLMPIIFATKRAFLGALRLVGPFSITLASCASRLSRRGRETR